MKTQIAGQGSRPDLIFGVFDRLDSIGHASGFIESPLYREYIAEFIEYALGQLLTAIQTSTHQRQEEWLVILTSDHGGHNDKVIIDGKPVELEPKEGGHGGPHGEESDRIIPFIGFVIRTDEQASAGYRYVELFPLLHPVENLNTLTQASAFPMILHFLGLQQPQNSYDRVRGVDLLLKGQPK